jgi:hypothetical protein
LYTSPNIIRMMKSWNLRWDIHVASMGPKMNTYRFSMRRPEGKRPLGRPRHRRKDNIICILEEQDAALICLLAVVNTVVKFRVSRNYKKIPSSSDIDICSRRAH